MQMERDRRPASELYLTHQIFHRPLGASMRSVLPDTQGANGVRSFVPAPPFCKRTRNNGSEPTEVRATETIVGNCCVPLTSSRGMLPHGLFPLLESSSDWMVNMRFPRFGRVGEE